MIRLAAAALLTLTLALAGCATAPAPAAETAAAQGPIQSPPLTPPANLKAPDISKQKLENGLRVWVLPDRSLPLVSVDLHLEAGSFDAPLEQKGLADFTAMMLRQGVEGMDADTLSRTVDMAGATLSAQAHGERTIISCQARTEHAELCLRLVALLALRPTFPEKEMGEVRDKLMGWVKQRRDDPGALASLHFNNQLFGDLHPEGVPVSATTLRRITREALAAFHGKFFKPGAALLGVSGDLEPAAAAALARKYFGPWAPGERPPRLVPPVKDPPEGLRVLLVDKPDLTQASFTLGHAGIPLGHKDRDAVRVLNHVLGAGGFSSRLMKKVRSEGGKTYGVRSSFSMYRSHGDFSVTSFTRTAELIATLDLVRGELSGIQTTPPTEAESAAARGKMAGGYPLSMQTTSALLHRLISAELNGLGQAYVTDYPTRIFGITPAQLKDAAARHLRPGSLVAAVVGKAEALAPALEKARIPFHRVNYLDPVSAAERRAASKIEARPKVSAEENRAARKLLSRWLRAAGGRKRLSKVRTLRLEGKVTLGPVSGSFMALIMPPTHLRMELHLQGMTMVQAMAGDKGFATLGPRRQALTPDRLADLRRALYVQPALLPLNALDEGVTARRVERSGLKKGQVAVEIFPPRLGSFVLVFDPRRGQLHQVRRQGPGNEEQVTELADHRRVKGVLIPHRTSTFHPKGGLQVVALTSVELNPVITPEMITEMKEAGAKGGATSP